MLDAICDAGRSALLERSVEKSYATGQVLWKQGDTPAGITLVLAGSVRIIRVSGARQTLIHSGESGSTLGEIPFFTRSTYPATAVAAEPTQCLTITYAALDNALRVDAGLAFVLLERLAARVENLVDRVSRLSGKTVQARLAGFLLARASRINGSHSRSPFSLGMTQVELAEELGTVREVVVRALRKLKNSGAIESAGLGRYVVSDLGALQEAVGADD